MIISKVVLSIYKIADLDEIEKDVFYFRYPNFSNFMRIVLILFILYFDPDYLISYALGITIIVIML